MTIKTRFATELSDEEQEIFIREFYDTIGVYDIDEDFEEGDGLSPCPWSCPWMHGSKIVLVGFTIQECVKNYCLDVRDEICGHLETERNFQEEGR